MIREKQASLGMMHQVYKLTFKFLCNCSQSCPVLSVHFSTSYKTGLFSAKRLMSIITPQKIKLLILFSSPQRTFNITLTGSRFHCLPKIQTAIVYPNQLHKKVSMETKMYFSGIFQSAPNYHQRLSGGWSQQKTQKDIPDFSCISFLTFSPG